MTEYDFTTFKSNLEQLTATELLDLRALTAETINTAKRLSFNTTCTHAKRRLDAIQLEIDNRSIPF